MTTLPELKIANTSDAIESIQECCVRFESIVSAIVAIDTEYASYLDRLVCSLYEIRGVLVRQWKSDEEGVILFPTIPYLEVGEKMSLNDRVKIWFDWSLSIEHASKILEENGEYNYSHCLKEVSESYYAIGEMLTGRLIESEPLTLI